MLLSGSVTTHHPPPPPPSFTLLYFPVPQVKMEDYFEHQGVFLHFSMFLNFIKGQGNKEQQEFWSEKASF